MERLLNRRNTVILIGMLTLWRLYLSATLQLHPDETYYWLWSRHLDVSYFDHPPMVAYFIWLTTLLSKAELWVRFSGTIVTLILSGLTWRLALQLFGSVPVAAGSVIVFNAYPLSMLGLIVMTPDVPLFLFSALSVYLFWQIMRGGSTRLWYLLGLSFGLALLSKYTAILLAPGFFLYLLLTEQRRCLRTVHPYLALLLGLLCFSPVAYWNSQHDWVSFEFQLHNGLGAAHDSFGKVVEYLIGQLLITGPVLWLLGMYAALVGLGRGDKATFLLASTALPIIAFFGLTSYRTLAGPNWPMYAYFTFGILLTRYCLAGTSSIRRCLWAVAVLTSLSLSAVITLHARFNLLPLERYSKTLARADATNWFYGWRELGAALKKYPAKVFVVTSSHQLSAEIAYYTDARVLALTDGAARPSQFNLWGWPSAELAGKAGLYVWVEGDAADGEHFLATAGAPLLHGYRDGRIVRTYHVVAGEQRPALPAAAN